MVIITVTVVAFRLQHRRRTYAVVYTTLVVGIDIRQQFHGLLPTFAVQRCVSSTPSTT